MKVKFDFVVEAWLQDIEIEADSVDAAKEALMKMSLSELIDEGYIKSTELKNIDSEITARSYDIKVTAVDYDVTEYDAPDDILEADVAKWVTDTKASLPQTFEFSVGDCSEDDLDDEVSDHVSDETGWMVNSVSYEIVKTY